MAKGKKNDALTIEERLEAALVPEDEQPYEVPENWCWVTIESINEYVSKAIDPSKDKEAYYELYSVPSSDDDYPEMIKGRDIGSSKQSVMQGDVLLCKINPRINRVWKVSKYSDNELIASSEWIVVRNQRINTEFLMYCFRSQYFREYMLSNVSGVGGSLMRAKPQYVKKYPLPLPPLSEQQRIVERIESLFSQLDEAKDKAQEALDEFELRRDSLLHKAFIGELTNKWRRENHLKSETWKYMSLRDCSFSIGDGLHGTPQFSDSEEYFFVNGNNFDGRKLLIKADTKRVGKAEYDKYYISLSKDKTVFVSINGTLGKTAFYNDEPIILGKSACYVNISDNLNKYYLRYYFESKEFRDYANDKATGSTIKNLGLKAMREMVIPVPYVEEQEEIVRILDNTLSEEDKLMEALENIIDCIELLKKSILDKAFRGELGTNDPDEESSVELLKQILEV